MKDKDPGGLFGKAVVTNMGLATLPLSFLQPGTTSEKWYPLERIDGMARIQGKLKVSWARDAAPGSPSRGFAKPSYEDELEELEGEEKPPPAPAPDVETEEQRAAREAENAAAGLPPGLDIRARDNLPRLGPNELTVVLVRATGLAVMDRSIFGRGSSDPSPPPASRRSRPSDAGSSAGTGSSR